MFKKMFLIMILVLFTSCVFTDYYVNDWGSKNVAQIENIFMRMDVIGKVIYSQSKIEVDAKAGGVCWPIGEGYIIGLTHATRLKATMLFRTPFGLIPSSRKIISEKFYIGKKEIKLIGSIDDITIFYHKDYQKAISAKWGDSDLVKLGDKVLIIGNSYSIGYNVKDGVISMLEVNHPRLPNAKNAFMISAPVNGGDSGSPLLIKRANILEIIGIVNANISQAQNIGFALKGNYIRDCIKKIIGKDILTEKPDFELDKR